MLGYVSSTQLASTLTSLQSSLLSTAAVNTTGTLLYLNFSRTVDSYHALELGPNYVTATPYNVLTYISTSVSDPVVADFKTNCLLPFLINPGYWNVYLFASTSLPSATWVYVSLYTVDTNQSESLIATSQITPITTTYQTPYQIDLFVPYTTLNTTSALVLRIFTTRQPPSQPSNIQFRITNNAAIVNWDPVANATSYTVEIYESYGTSFSNAMSNVDDTTTTLNTYYENTAYSRATTTLGSPVFCNGIVMFAQIYR